MKRNLFKLISISLISILLASCSSGGSSNGGQDGGCDGGCAKQSLTASDVSLILRQGISEATLRGLSANLAVLDRVGNVLAVYKMPGASINTKIDGQIGASGGLEGAMLLLQELQAKLFKNILILASVVNQEDLFLVCSFRNFLVVMYLDLALELNPFH
jgi:hypothetical protein